MDMVWSWILLFFPAHSCERILQGSLVLAVLVLIDVVSVLWLRQHVHIGFFHSEVWCTGIGNIWFLLRSTSKSMLLGSSINEELRQSYNFMQRATTVTNQYTNDFRAILRNLGWLMVNIATITFFLSLAPMDAFRNQWYAWVAPQLSAVGIRTCESNPAPWQQVELVTITSSQLCLLSRTSDTDPWTTILPQAFYAAGVQPVEQRLDASQVSLLTLSSQNPAVNTVVQQCDATQCVASIMLNVFGQAYILVTDQPRAIPLVKVTSNVAQSLEFLRPQRVDGLMVYHIDQTGVSVVMTPDDDIRTQCMRK